MNVVNPKKTRKSRITANYDRSDQNLGNSETVINQKVLHDISSTLNKNNQTNLNKDSQVILALAEGRGHAKGEVGIASIDICSPVLMLTQISDNFWYTDTINKIQILNPIKILLMDTTLEVHPFPKLVEFIKDNFSHIAIVPVQRRHFNDKNAMELINKHCSTKSKNLQQVIIARKYYALAAASAVLSYLKTVNLLVFGKNCLKLNYQTKHNGLMMDNLTSSQLELLYSLSSYVGESKRYNSLFSILNNCVTRIGQRHLRANILEPSCDIQLIKNRQDQIKVLIEKIEVLRLLKEALVPFNNVDRLLKISYIVPQDDSEKAMEINIQAAFLLKNILVAIGPLIEACETTYSLNFEDMKNILSLQIYKDIVAKINLTVQPDVSQSKLARKHFQYLYSIKSGLNETIDFLRQVYSEVIDKIRECVSNLQTELNVSLQISHSAKIGYHILLKNPNHLPVPKELTEIYKKGNNYYLTCPDLLALNDTTKSIYFDVIKMSNSLMCDMLLEIAQEIDAIYNLTGIIIDLDIIQSLTEVSEQNEFCCPSFSRILKIEEGYHPLLVHKRNKTSVIKNNVIATPQYNFYLINGPNMSGKTVYIKMIAVIQVMAQIGCFVPALSAQLRMTDKLFSRIGFHDNLEQNASSFTIELREIEYIYSNLTPNSLVIIDELCRSTNPTEGEIICWNFCEKLLNFIGVSNDDYFKLQDEDDNEDQTNVAETFVLENVNDSDIPGNTGNKPSTSRVPDENVAPSNPPTKLLGHKSRNKLRNNTLLVMGKANKLKDIARPYIFMTTHFTSLKKLTEKFNNLTLLHMEVDQKTVDDNQRLDFKYKIQYGGSKIKSYGISLARLIRLPRSLIDRADELVDQISDDSINELLTTTLRKETTNVNTARTNNSILNTEMLAIEKECFDIFSFVSLLLNSDQDSVANQTDNMEVITEKVSELTGMMSPEFLEIVEQNTIKEIVNIINSSGDSNKLEKAGIEVLTNNRNENKQ